MSSRGSQSKQRGQTTLLQNWGYYGNQIKRTTDAEEPIVIDDDLDEEDEQAFLAACEAVEGQFPSASSDVKPQNREVPSVPEASPLESLPGFDEQAGKLWIYPTNYPVRNYQFNIVCQALKKNTLVTLPTGLGKTFIAAVVMFNFYRWYPQGKVVFMAPTKPLVAQQIEACFNIMGIPETDMAEMTGSMAPSERKRIWKIKRVFFLTPQVLTNDLSRQACPAVEVKCLVVDEAHKALGNHAYCEVVRELSKYTPSFRVLALSATPGGDLKAVQQVLNNLLISHVEIRSEESVDIQQYAHERKVEKIVVPLGEELKHIQKQYLEMLNIYVQRLSRAGAIFRKDPASLSKFQLLRARDAFQQDPPPQVQSRGAVEGDFAISLSLYHGYELLMQHGTRTLYNFLSNTVDSEKGFSRTRQELMRNGDFINIMNILKEKFDYNSSRDGDAALFGTLGRSSQSPSHSISCTQKSKKFVVSHPKMQKLQEIVIKHFKNYQSFSENKPSTSEAPVDTRGTMDTRVMIFAQYRDSVQEIAEMLNCHQPLVRCMSFVGQSSAGKATKGISQKEQLRVVKEFRCGNYNTLVSTCVGEEGLDIGDVDLIVCYDAHKSPTRLVQRMGRTGRKRKGRIVMLMTEGKEASVYDKSQYSRRGIHKALQSNSKSLQLYPSCPRMIPRGLDPQPHKMHITGEKYQGKKKTKRGGPRTTGDTINSFVNRGQEKSSKASPFLNQEEYTEWTQKYKIDDANIPTISMRGSFRSLGEPRKDSSNRPKLSLSSWSLWQSKEQSSHLAGHSQRCKNFVSLMELMEIQDQIDGEDIYGMEMAIHLKDQDIVKSQAPKGIEKFCRKKPTREKRDRDKMVKLSEEERDDEQKNQMQNARRRKRKKKPVLPLLESDDDFVDDTVSDVPNVRLNKETNKCGTVDEPRMPSMVTATEEADTAGVEKIPEVDRGDKLVALSDAEEEEENQMMNVSRRRKKKKRPALPLLVSDESDDDIMDETGAALPDIQLDEKTKETRTRMPSMKDNTSEECSTGIQGGQADAEVQKENFEKGNLQKAMKNDQPKDVVTHKLKDSPSFTNPENHGGEAEGPRNMHVEVLECNKEMLAEDTQGEKTRDEPRKGDQNNNREKVDKSNTTVEEKCQSNLKKRTEVIAIIDTLKEDDLVRKQGEPTKNLDKNEKHSKDVDAIISVQESCNQGREKKDDETSESNVKAERSRERSVAQEEENKISTDINLNLSSRECKVAQTEEEAALSMYFPCSQFSFVHSTSEDKKVSPCPLPPSPPSVSSLDVLDDIELNYGTPGLKSCFTRDTQSSSTKEKKEPESLEMKQPPATHVKVKCLEKSSMAEGGDQFERSETDNVGDNGDEDSSRAASEKDVSEKVVQQEAKDIAAVLNFDLVPEERTEGNAEGMPSVRPSSEKVTESLCLDDLQGLEDDWDDSLDAPVPMEIQTPNFSASKPSHQKSSVFNSFVRVDMGAPSSHSTPVTRKVRFIEDARKESPDFHQQVSTLAGKSENINSSDDKSLVTSSEDQIKQSKISSPKEVMPLSDGAPVSFSSKGKMDAHYIESDIGVNFDLNFDLNSLDDEDEDDQLPVQTTPVRFPSLPPNSLCLPKAESTPLNNSKYLRRSVSSLGMTSITETSNRTFGNKTRTDGSNTENSSKCKDIIHHESSGMTPTAKGEFWTGTSDSPTEHEQSDSNVGERNTNLLRKLSFCNTSDIADTEKRDFTYGGENLWKDSPQLGSAKGASVQMATSATDSGNGADKGFTKIKTFTESSASSKAHVSADSQGFEVDQSASSIRVKRCESEPVIVSDEEEPLSQITKPKKRRKNVMRSPETPSPDCNRFHSKERRKNARMILHSSSEDEDKNLMSPPRKKRRQKRFLMSPTLPLTEAGDDDADFEDPSPQRFRTHHRKQTTHRVLNNKTTHKKEKKRRAHVFLDEEAEVSDDGKVSSDEEGSVLDHSLDGFINDATQMSQDMHAVYMKSIRSPAGNKLLHPARNRFRMSHKGTNNDNIFSQVPQQDVTYMEDSFVVEGEDYLEEVSNLASTSHINLENTINVDNIIGGTGCKRLRGRRAGESKAERILRLGRKAVLKSNSTEEDSESDHEPSKVTYHSKSKHLQDSDQRLGKGLSTGRTLKPSTSNKLIRHNEDGGKLSCKSIQGQSARSDRNIEVESLGNLDDKGLGINCSKEPVLVGHSNNANMNFDLNFEDDFFLESAIPVKDTCQKFTLKEQTLTTTKEQLEKAERLRKQKEKQEEFRKKMASKRKSPDSSSETACNSAANQEERNLRGLDVAMETREKKSDTTQGPLAPSQKGNLTIKYSAQTSTKSNSAKPVILISSKELASSPSIVSTLAIKHGVDPRVCQLRGCDFSVSNRMGVEKQTLSEFSSGSNKMKLVERFKEMRMRYDKLCIIIEKDRLKRDEKPKQIIRTKHFDSMLAAMANSPVKILFSDSTDETALILTELARVEARKGFAIVYPKELTQSQEQVLNFCLSIPTVNYGAALSMTINFTSLSELITCSEEYLKEKTGIYGDRARSIVEHFHHQFDEQMMSTPKR